MAYCVDKTKAGKDCTAQAMQGASFCYRHNPAISDDDKRQASTVGGSKTNVLTNADPVSVKTITGIVNLIEQNINQVRTGEIAPTVSNAIVQNINALLKVQELAMVDTRIRKLEEQAGIDNPSELIDMGDN